MRIVFFGTPDFALESLRACVESGHEVVAVVTQPDRERDRRKVTYSPVKQLALELGLKVLQYEKVSREGVEELGALKADLFVTCAFGQILSQKILDIPPLGTINVHGSLLPKYRGAAPIQYAVKDGEAVSGVTIMLLDEGMDTGAILKKAEIKLDPKETTGSLFDKLSVLGAQTLTDVLAHIEEYERNACPQDESQATYTAKIDKETAQIDWTQDAIVIERLIRTLDPHPGAYTWLDGKRLKVWSADVVDGAGAEPGTIIAVTKKNFTVQTGSGALCVREVQPESRKRMQTAQFLQGISLQPGDVLTRE